MGIIIGSCLHKIVGISSFFWKMMKGIFLTVLAFFVASCQMKKYLIEAESSEDADYEVTTKHHLGDQKCRIWKTRTLKEKCTPGEMYRQWCPEFKKQVADECGEGSDYKDSKPEGYARVVRKLSQSSAPNQRREKRIIATILRNLLRESVAQRALTTRIQNQKVFARMVGKLSQCSALVSRKEGRNATILRNL